MRYQTVYLLVGLALLIGFVALLWFARPLVDSLIIAGLLAYLLHPLVCQFEKRLRLSRGVAATAVYSLSLLVIAGVIGALGATVWGQIPRLLEEFQEALAEMSHWLERPVFIFGYELHPEAVLQNLQRSAGNAFATVPVGSLLALTSVANNLLWSLVVLVGLYYLLKDGPQIKPWLVSFLPPRFQDEGQRLLDEIDSIWGIFLRMQLLIFAILAVLMIASTLLIVWLFRSGWLPLSPVGLIILFVIVYTAIQQVDNIWLRPQLLGRSLQLHPGVVFVGLIAALALSGLLGAIIIVPVMATFKVIGRYIHAKLLGLPPWPVISLPNELESTTQSAVEINA